MNDPLDNKDGIDLETLQAYNNNADQFAECLEKADRSYVQQQLLTIFQAGTNLLEIGCGSGAEAAKLISQNRNVIATDPSIEMLKQARARHPELEGCLKCAALPNLPFKEKEFVGIYAITVLMHLPIKSDPNCLSKACLEMARVLAPGGSCYIVTFDARSDLDENSRDKNGRLQNIIPQEVLVGAMQDANFLLYYTRPFSDPLGRPGICPREYLFNKREFC